LAVWQGNPFDFNLLLFMIVSNSYNFNLRLNLLLYKRLRVACWHRWEPQANKRSQSTSSV